MSYSFSDEALDDLRDAVDFYERERLGLGLEFAVAVGGAIAVVTEAPNRWPAVGAGVRKYRLDRFPFGVYYRTGGGRQVKVIAVLDLRSRAGAWGS